MPVGVVRIWVGSIQREGYENLRCGTYHVAKNGKARVEELLNAGVASISTN